jgi:hypothetical protein
MNSDSNVLVVEMFDGLEFGPTLPEIADIEMARVLAEVDARMCKGAGDLVVKQIECADFLKAVLGDVPAPEPAPLPTVAGQIPASKPNTARSPKSTARRKKLQALITDSGLLIADYPKEAIESLLTAMEAYVENAIQGARGGKL